MEAGVRYVAWVERVFRAVADANRGNLGPGAGLDAVGAVLGFDGLTSDDFVARDGSAGALMTAMYDLDALGVVKFANVSYGNGLTAEGRDRLEAGLSSLWPSLFEIPASSAERVFLARLYSGSALEDDGWAGLRFVDADPIYAECGIPTAEYADQNVRFQFCGDLERKGLIRAEHHAAGAPNIYRPTYRAAVLVSAADPRHGAARAGLIDWTIPATGFEAIEEELAALKTKLDAAITDADRSDVGLRCRRILVDEVRLVFRPEMVPSNQTPPSRQDADEMLGYYLRARRPGKDNEPYRKFVRGAWGLASARVHADRTGRAAAIAAAQGTLSFVRAVEAIERTVGPQVGPSEPPAPLASSRDAGDSTGA